MLRRGEKRLFLHALYLFINFQREKDDLKNLNLKVLKLILEFLNLILQIKLQCP